MNFFFVLSGFILTKSYWPFVSQKKALPPFALKRFIRVYPFYWAMLILITIAYGMLGKNIFQLLHIDALSLIKIMILYDRTPHPIPPVWSMMYELLFYLIFALLFLLPTKKCAALSVVGYGAVVLFMNIFNLYTGLIFNSVMMNFLIGMGMYYLYDRFYPVLSPYTKWIVTVSSVALLLSWGSYAYQYNIHSIIDIRLAPLLLGLPLGFLVLGASISESHHPQKWMNRLSFLGTISYSLYLSHFGLVILMVNGIRKYIPRKQTVLFSDWLSFLILCVTLCGGAIFWVLIEKPFLERSGRLFLRKTPTK